MKITILIALAALTCVGVDGRLYCHTCINALSNRDCQKYGEYKRCQKNENACHNSVRKGPFGIMITKRCKQVMACDNNYIQNPRSAWMPSQCNRGTISSVCRCCCTFDGCNGPRLFCLKNSAESNCRAMPTPLNGSRKCTKRNMSVGTVCRFQCDQGYAMEGKRRSKCIRSKGSDPKFNRPPPICKPITACPKIPNAPQDGSVDCTDGNQIGSICTFECNAPHDIVGEKEITCRGNGEWSSLPPTCAVAECNTLTPPVNGNMICTLDNQEDSECTFSCLDGYQLVGAPSAVCIVVNGAGVWSENVPVCEPKVCDAVIDPENGNSVCDDGTNVDSSCRFACDDAYNLVGSAVTTCVIVNGNPRWDLPTPVCEPKVCDPVIDPENGNSVCDDGTNVDSICRFACDDGYNLQGPTAITCVIFNGNPRWDLPTPICAPRLPHVCDPVIDPAYGASECDVGNYVGSSCRFVCNDGYSLVGSATTTCLFFDIPRWDPPTPVCEPKACDPVIDPENGNSVCDDATNVFSSCRFACDDAYNLVGSAVTTCEFFSDNPRWDLPTPVCEPKVCDPVIDPENGNSVCDDGTNVDSSCRFACDDGYNLVGSAVTTCVIVNGNPRWDLPPPVCEPSQCEMEAPFYNGNVTCTNGNIAGSVCTYTCNDNRDFVLTPPEVTTNQCLNNKTWNVPRPCCYAMCTADETNFDGLIILDSSSSVGTENFDMMKEFVKQIVSLFNIGQNASRIGLFRYNRRVDSRSQIHLSQYLDDKPGLLDAIDRIPYNGAGTFTGRALTYARDEFREEFNGNRENVHDIIILITDGRAADNVAIISSQLRLQGVTVIVVGVEPPRGQLDRDQLLTIATTPGDLVIAEGGFSELSSTVIFDIVQSRFCVEGCLVL